MCGIGCEELLALQIRLVPLGGHHCYTLLPPPAFIMSVGLGCDTWPTSILNLGLGDSRDFCHILRKKLQDGL